MSRTFPVQATFYADGLFWFPDDADNSFPGRLSCTRGRVELAPPAHVDSLEGALSTATNTVGTIYGVTPDGNCTLFDLIELRGPGTFLASGGVLATTRYHARTCIMGAHLRARVEPALTSAYLRYSGLPKWFPSGFGMKFDAETAVTSVSWPMTPVRLPEIEVPEIGAQLIVSVGVEWQRPRDQLHAKSTVVVGVKTYEPQALEWYRDTATRLESFFSLLLGASVKLKSMEIALGPNSGYVIEETLARAGKVNPSGAVECTSAHLGDAMRRWLSVPEQFRAVENLIYGTIRNSSLFVETEFLSLAQAVESLHRVTDNSLIMAEAEFKEVKRVLSALFNFFFRAETEIRERLRESVAHANEPTFRGRVWSLVARISEPRAVSLLGPLDNFVDALVNTRNFFTHAGITLKSDVLTDPVSLFTLNQKLHAFLRLLVLLYVGFPEDLVFEKVRSQVTRI
jgi:hypothetical protein